MYGYTEKEAAGSPFTFLVSEPGRAKLLQQLESVEPNETMSPIGKIMELQEIISLQSKRDDTIPLLAVIRTS
ncbi:hypothetical protein [Paenibacillus spongiae]|uniref:PAS domain S-box protein n=1 Tax=Paenibacillus spongiae TaxID=2909671 RepID=A0ABY5S1Z5_9BACL|nr:hypothetical protein [Paenibacillus spongiae]UVI27679.1 hypothetical protein L1F29_19650 [Paenibacillus spongiae]